MAQSAFAKASADKGRKGVGAQRRNGGLENKFEKVGSWQLGEKLRSSFASRSLGEGWGLPSSDLLIKPYNNG